MTITYENLFQWAFAMSPFPSYLPQYLSIIQQLSVDNINSINGDGIISSSTQPDIATNSTSDRGDSLRKRNHHHDPAPFQHH